MSHLCRFLLPSIFLQQRCWKRRQSKRWMRKWKRWLIKHPLLSIRGDTSFLLLLLPYPPPSLLPHSRSEVLGEPTSMTNNTEGPIHTPLPPSIFLYKEDADYCLIFFTIIVVVILVIIVLLRWYLCCDVGILPYPNLQHRQQGRGGCGFDIPTPSKDIN